jgi:ATP-dependent DNA helicase RecG
MNHKSKIKSLIEQGENSAIEFKSSSVRPEKLARELVAFANSSGGTLLLGVEDDGTVSGLKDREHVEEWVANIVRNNIVPAISPSIQQLTFENKQIVRIDIPRGMDKPYQTIDGKFWIRVGSTNRMATKEELSRLFQQAGLVHFDIAPLEGTLPSDLDSKKLDEYWSTYYDINYSKLEAIEQKRLLMNADILSKVDENECASVGGLLIFGIEPQRKLPQSSITFAIFNGLFVTNDLLDKHEIKGTLAELIRQASAKIETFIPKPSIIKGMVREEKPAIPSKVIREALVNAVCHRDYSIGNRRITIFIFKDRLEITSPGRLPNTLNIEKILTGNSAPRNNFILKYLDNMKFIDGLGRGVPMIKQLMGNRFNYSEDGEMLRLTLYFESGSQKI